eukprot:TRINITY_DN4689_c0_g1_i4.p1 TRINITY_DN4689_c0_g1~~TRINITY_DN4689_c0_g1_i4.p1  ORF type:complete len:580 (+),score=140.87 TRINITY_DN4689_c0_g1_i4:290-2029(+)
MLVFDVSTPSAPVQLARLGTVVGYIRVGAGGSMAYVANDQRGVYAVDISNPAAPVLVGNHTTGGGHAMRFSVVGTTVYLASFSNLQIVDFSTPSAPKKLVHNSTCRAYCVSVKGNRAYVGTVHEGIQIFDVSDPSVLTYITTMDLPFLTIVWDLEVNAAGTVLYAVADGRDGGVLVIDVSQPTPVQVGKMLDRNVSAVRVSGDHVYVSDEEDGLQVLDVSTPGSPVLAGTYSTWNQAQKVHVSGSYAYVADRQGGLQVFDVTDASSLVLAGTYRFAGGAQTVHAVGTTVYVGADKLYVLDASTPSAIVLLGSYASSGAGGVYDIHVEEEEGKVAAYVADGAAGLLVLDVKDAADIKLLGSLAAGRNMKGLFKPRNATVMYAADELGLAVIDVSNTAAPRLMEMVGLAQFVGNPNETIGAKAVYTEGGTAYIASDNGLCVVNVSVPANPVFLGDTFPYRPYDVQVAEGVAYMATSTIGLLAVDVSEVPKYKQYDTTKSDHRLPSSARGVQIVNHTIYVANVGLWTLNRTATPTIAGDSDDDNTFLYFVIPIACIAVLAAVALGAYFLAGRQKKFEDEEMQ